MYCLKDNHLKLHHWGVSCVREPEATMYYPSRNDLLWKGIVEDLPEDFLRFFFPGIEEHVDLTQGVEYMDKELLQLFPPEAEEFAPRRVDKLIRLFSNEKVAPGRGEAFREKGKSNSGEKMLLHCEVQGYRDKDFARRMFRYYCRVWDKYQCRIKALAILTDGDKNFRPAAYREDDDLDHENRLDYSFKVYKVLDQSEELLKKSDNPFATVILITQTALKRKSGQLSEEDLFTWKLELAQGLHEKQISKTKRQVLLDFLLYYLPFRKKEMNVKFEKSISKLTGRTITMGLREVLLEDARLQGEVIGEKRGLQRGIEQGIEQGIETGKRIFVQTLIRNSDFNDRKIASLTSIEESVVKKIRSQMAAKGKSVNNEVN